MPRIGAEARGASAYRSGSKAPEVPAGFSKEATAIWNEVVSAKPVDWFDGGSLRLLAQYCRTMVQAERVAREMDSPEVRADDRELEARERRLVALNGNCTTLATKLRITVQLTFDTRSGMLTEKTEKKSDDNLLGVKATWPGNGAKLRAVS